MIDIVQFGKLKDNNGVVDYSKYGLKNRDDFVDRKEIYSSEIVDEVNKCMKSSEFVLSNHRDENNKYIQQIIFPPTEGITTFNISRNYVNNIPFELLPNSIRILDVSHTMIYKETIDKFPNESRYIKISETNVSEICNIPHKCKTLTARGCRLRYVGPVPETMKALHLEGNNLKKLPNNLTKCSKLSDLCYEGNKLLEVSVEEMDFIQKIFEERRIRQEKIDKETKKKVVQRIEYAGLITQTDGGTDNTIIEKEKKDEEMREEKRIQQVINDSQNVHDTTLNTNLSNSVDKLKKFYENKVEMSGGLSVIKKSRFFGRESKVQVSLKEYIGHHCIDKLKSLLGSSDFKLLKELIQDDSLIFERSSSSFGDIFRLVFFRTLFLPFEVQNEIYDMLKYDFSEMKQVCLIGKVGRIINLLNGKCEEVMLISNIVSKNERIQQIHHLCKVQAKANYRNLVFEHMSFDDRVREEIDESSLLFRKILYILFEHELKQMKDVSDEECNIWLEPLVLNEDEIDKLKSKGKEQDEIDIKKMVDETIDGFELLDIEIL